MSEKVQNQGKGKMGKSAESAPLLSRPTNQQILHYWNSINYVSSLIKASELKAGLILSFYGILLNFIFHHVGRILDASDSDFILFVLFGSWFTLIGISVFYSIRCFMPRLEIAYEPNIFFFGDIISKFGDIHEFSAYFYEISQNKEELFSQLGQQVFVNAKIANVKFKYVNRSLRYLGINLLLLLIIAVYFSVRYVEVHSH